MSLPLKKWRTFILRAYRLRNAENVAHFWSTSGHRERVDGHTHWALCFTNQMHVWRSLDHVFVNMPAYTLDGRKHHYQRIMCFLEKNWHCSLENTFPTGCTVMVKWVTAFLGNSRGPGDYMNSLISLQATEYMFKQCFNLADRSDLLNVIEHAPMKFDSRVDLSASHLLSAFNRLNSQLSTDSLMRPEF